MNHHVTLETLEGRLLAQRKVLARLLVELQGDALDDFLAHRDHVEEYSEDPGAVPDPAFAVEAAMAEEIRLIREAAERFRGSR